MYTYTYPCIYTYIHIYIYIYTSLPLSLSLSLLYVYVCMYACMYVCMHTYIYIYIYTHVYVYVYVYVYVPAYTCTNTHGPAVAGVVAGRAHRPEGLPLFVCGGGLRLLGCSNHHTCHILPPSETDVGLCLAVFTGSGGKYLFHRIG